ncbi:hypothetical protein N665_0133s0020 [Sinapis alba]|nr:hypothetical protein N665_0133s0020 [Sinapis alba]
MPERLFATDRFPSERVNKYSNVDYLLAVRDVLIGTPEMEKLMGSCFGGLFRIPTCRLLMGIVVHGMMMRQVVSKKKYEMWPVFGGKLLWFSLVEFGEVTGLPCGEFEDGYSIDYQLPQKYENYDYWERLIGSNRDVTIKDLVAMVYTEKEMPGWRKFRLCLLIIVDGVLVATTQKPRPSLKYVKMLEDLKKFLAFPWVRESFLWTISTLKPPPKIMETPEIPEVEDVKAGMPERLFATDRFPSERVNMYSTVDYLLAVRDVLTGTPEMEKLLGSCFGGLFRIPACRLLMGRVVHGMIMRQVVSKKKYEMWPAFGGNHYGFCWLSLGKLRACHVGSLKMVMGKCENPTGDFCKKLRHKTPKTVGFPLSLQLVAYQAIPQLLKQVGGDDSTTLLDYRGKALPQHAGLVLADIQKAEHEAGRFDKKVDYMVKLLKKGHVFTKAHWGGGDAGDPLYVYSEKKKNKKRKNKGAVVTGEGPVLKQRRVSAYFKRGAFVDDEKYAKMEARVEELGEEVSRLKGLFEKQARQLKKLKNMRKGKSGSKRQKSLKKTEKEGIGRRHDGVDDEHDEDGDAWQAGGENVTKRRGYNSTPQETKGASSEEGHVMLARLNDGNGEPSQWVEGGKTGAGDKVLYEGVTSNTYFVTEDEVDNVVCNNISGDGVRENVYPLSYVDQGGTVGRGDECEGEADGNEQIGSGDDMTDEEVVKPDVDSGVLDVSDSPIATAERHIPVEQEEAAVLLTKDQFHITDIVAFYEACDYPFFERVLKANINVMHYDAGSYDLDNRFFVELAKKHHWVSSTVELCISLVDWSILVMDPNPHLKSMEEVDALMEPVVTMLSYIAKKVCPAAAVGEHQLVPFHVECLEGVYVNVRSGDCGPVAVKFLEMHETGNKNPTMVGLTDDLVDMFRKQYAMEIYKCLIVPLYLG